MTAFFYVYLGLIGLAVGSFLNVVIVRMPAKESIWKPASKCPQCQSEIKRYDNIPVISWLLLKGKCRSCGEPIPVGYPLVELTNLGLWLAAGVRFGPHWIIIPYLFLFSVLLAQSVIDLELYILLDRITFPAVAASIPMLIAAAYLSRDTAFIGGDPKAALIGAAIGGVGYFLFLGIFAVISPRGMGLGDVKLALLMGLYLGFLNPALILFSLILASALGIVVGGVFFFARGRKSENFPFGPWLAVGCIVAILFDTTILKAFNLTLN